MTVGVATFKVAVYRLAWIPLCAFLESFNKVPTTNFLCISSLAHHDELDESASSWLV